MWFFRIILFVIFIYFLWRFIKIIFRILSKREDVRGSSTYANRKFTDIEEAKFEDITPPKEDFEPDETDLSKN